MTTKKTKSPRYLAAAASAAAGELVLADGTIWSHAATLGTRTKGDQFTIGPDEVKNAVKVFTSGYPQKIPVDYEHGSTTNDPEIRKMRAQGAVPKAGDVCELKAVLSAADFTGDLKAAAEKLSAQAKRPLEDPRNLGLWMRWKPTARALQAIKAGEYTELSIAFDEDIPHNVDEAGQGFGLWAVALLNRPFLDDMLPVAASRDTDPPPAGEPASREGSMKSLGSVTALAAVFALTVTSDEDAAVELPKLLPKVRANHQFTQDVSTELGESEPGKAVAKIKQLRAENESFKAAAAASAKAAAKATAEATLKEYEPRISSKPLREMLLRQLIGELEAGKKVEDAETLVTLKSLPKATQLGQASSADAGGDQATDDVKLDARARELMQSNPRLKALAAKDEYAAYKDALFIAEREMRGAAAATA